jgi:phage terminase small subunit
MHGTPAKLDERQHKFIECLANGVGLDLSAAAAGYDAFEAQTLLQTPRISRLVELRVRSALQNDYAPRAMKFLADLAENTRAPLKERRMAAQWVAERAGYVAPRAPIGEADEKSISAMTPAELADLVEKLEAERASRAKDVSAPKAQELDSEATDMLS